jgi:DNA-binding NarL/FixJ family response regulator
VLEKAGHEVKAVGTQRDAEAAFASDPPDLMLVNLASEKLGRADLIRRVKAVSPSTKVVAFISHTRIPEFRESVLAAGADKLCANSAISMRLPDIVRSVMAGASGVEEE